MKMMKEKMSEHSDEMEESDSEEEPSEEDKVRSIKFM